MSKFNLGKINNTPERIYFSNQDILAAQNGYISKANVITYDNSTRTGTCQFNGSIFPFKNATTQNYAAGNIIIVNYLQNDNHLVAHGVYASA